MGVGTFESSEGQMTARQALAVDRCDGAVELLTTAGTGGWNHCGHRDQGGVLNLLQFVDRAVVEHSGAANWASHQLHRACDRLHGGRVAGFAGAVQADHQAQPTQHVLFLTFQPADISQSRFRRCRVGRTTAVPWRRAGQSCDEAGRTESWDKVLWKLKGRRGTNSRFARTV